MAPQDEAATHEPVRRGDGAGVDRCTSRRAGPDAARGESHADDAAPRGPAAAGRSSGRAATRRRRRRHDARPHRPCVAAPAGRSASVSGSGGSSSSRASTSRSRRYWRTTCDRDPDQAVDRDQDRVRLLAERVARDAAGRPPRARRRGRRRRAALGDGRERVLEPVGQALALGGEAVVAEALEQVAVVQLDGRLGAARVVVEARLEGGDVEVDAAPRSGSRPCRRRCRARRPARTRPRAGPGGRASRAWRSEPAEAPSASGHRSAAIASRERGRRARTSRANRAWAWRPGSRT